MRTSRIAASRFDGVLTQEQATRDYLQAFSQTRDLRQLPPIQQMEHYAEDWASLVPSDKPEMLAALAYEFGRKYQFTGERVPKLRQVLGIDDPDTAEMYSFYYDEPIRSIYAERLSLLEQIKWAASRLGYWIESLPPFWSAYSLTLTETVGASVLALPIAFAGVGPLAGIVLLLVLGLVNILTLAGFAEAITRSGDMRFGTTFLAGMVKSYLGPLGASLLTGTLLLMILIMQPAFYIGISSTLEAITNLPAAAWIVVIFLLATFFARRDSLDSTIASAIVIGFINITVILIISALALTRIDPANLQVVNVPFINGQGFDSSILELVFGVALAAFFGHTSAANAAKTVLQRDPDGKALIWGNIAALSTALVIYCLWVFAVNGAVPPEVLQGTTGTALEPLADTLGPGVLILGTLFVVIGMGFGTIHFELALTNQMREWLSGSSLESQAVWLISVPSLIVFMLTEYLLLTNQQSYSGLLSFSGVITVPIVAGLFPIILLLASRRRGEYIPGVKLGILGNPVFAATVFTIFFASIVIHGLFIWEVLWQQISALAISVLLVVAFVLITKRGAFRKRAVVEVRSDDPIADIATLRLVDAGKLQQGYAEIEYKDAQPASANGIIKAFSSVKKLTLPLQFESTELKVWLHQVDDNGYSSVLDGEATVLINGIEKASGKDVVLAPTDKQIEIEITHHTFE